MRALEVLAWIVMGGAAAWAVRVVLRFDAATHPSLGTRVQTLAARLRAN
jgi:hypothetical protein